MDENLLYLCFLALAVLPLLLAVRQIASARRGAKTEMVRRAFELERHARQRSTPGQHQRAAVVAHHCVLSYLEEVLETCVYGTKPSPIPMHALHTYKQRIQNASKVAGQGSVALQGDVESLQAVCLAPRDDVLVSTADGLRGAKVQGGLNLTATQQTPEFYSQCEPSLLCGMPTMRVSGRLKNVRKFCEFIVEVVLYKYGWQGDEQLREASIQIAEAKLLESSRTGRFWCSHFGTVGACNVLCVGAFRQPLTPPPPKHTVLLIVSMVI